MTEDSLDGYFSNNHVRLGYFKLVFFMIYNTTLPCCTYKLFYNTYSFIAACV